MVRSLFSTIVDRRSAVMLIMIMNLLTMLTSLMPLITTSVEINVLWASGVLY